ncbi:MAG: hypothetical protein WBM86_30340 [Waterburya sp.]
MNNPFRPTSRHKPCLCCGEVKYRCRKVEADFKLPNFFRSGIMYLCMNERGDLPGFKYRGETKNYLWGKYITQELANELEMAWQEKHYHHQNKSSILLKNKPTSPLPRFKHLLPTQARHQAISSLLEQLTLSPKHHWQIKQRGFDPQIIVHYQFRTINYRQKLTLPISDRLAGVAPGGKELTNNYSGILIPIQNHEQLWNGWQTRLDWGIKCKYLWPTSDKYSAHDASTGTLPLAYLRPLKGVKSKAIALVEGVGFKAIYTANRFGQITIGASGGMFASSVQQLELFLKEAAVETGNNHVLLYPDAGAVRNYLILNQYQATFQLVTELGFELKVAWWGQFTKAQPDIDEHEGAITIISWQQFWALAKKLVINKKAWDLAFPIED